MMKEQRRNALGWLFVGLAGVLMGCDRQQITVYQVPKEPLTVAGGGNAAAAGGDRHAHWKLPAGWEELSASGMRVGSFKVKGSGDQVADVSVIPLPGVAGAELDNVNRWRGQLGLEPVSLEQLNGVKVAVGDEEGALYDMSGSNPQSKQPERILATILTSGGTTWFFKMTGPPELVESQKQAFRDFLKGVTLHGADAHGGQAAQGTRTEPAAAIPRESREAAAPVAAADPVAAGETAGMPKWEVPAHWQSQAATTMLLARFAIPGSDGRKAELTVSSFPGDVGGLAANVNRWRGQIGLPPVSGDELTKVTQPIDVHGMKSTLVDIANPNGKPSLRMMTAVVPREGKTWFFKLLGDAAVVEKERAAFMKFLQTIRF